MKLNLERSRVMIVAILAINFVFGFAGAKNIGDDIFDHYKNQYNKSYTPEEKLKRKQILLQSAKLVQDWNKLYEEGQVTYTLKTNILADRTEDELFGLVTPEEIRAKFEHNLGDNRVSSNLGAKRNRKRRYSTRSLPTFKDWRETNCIPPVRSQGSCGSCYAFSTLDLLTANKCIRQKREYLRVSSYYIFSPQYVIDCARVPGVYGCNGGWPPNLIDWINKQERIPMESQYPYEERRNYQCKNITDYKPYVSSSYHPLIYEELHDEESFMEHLLIHGPIVAAMRASRKFVLYDSGIFADSECKKLLWSHAVLVVGYGRESGKDYWIIKNSWNNDWGEDGYGRIVRGKKMCQMGQMGWGIVGSI